MRIDNLAKSAADTLGRGVGRRNFLAGGTILSGLALAQNLFPPALKATDPSGAAEPAAAVVSPSDARYPDVTVGNNARWVGKPESVVLPGSTTQVIDIVQQAVTAKKRLTVRGGGHCYSDFVYNPDVQVVLDLSRLNGVSWDAQMGAFAIEAGGTLLDIYERLYKGWGVTIPGGMCYSVGIGGHVAGGGYGLLSRRHGTTADHLYAIEVVCVDASGVATRIVATRDPADRNRELWWAHTGGGGGNFGVVTKYWFRSPDMDGTTPETTLMSPPGSVYVSALGIPWDSMDQDTYTAMVDAFTAWHQENAGTSGSSADLCSFLMMNHQSNGSMGLLSVIDSSAPGALNTLNSFVSSVLGAAGVSASELEQSVGEVGAMPGFAEATRLPWMHSMQLLGTNNPTLTDPTSRGIHKSAYLKKPFTPVQSQAMFKHLTRTDLGNPKSMVVLLSYGGQINQVSPDATASVQRKSIFKGLFQSFWSDPAADADNLAWTRDVYADVFSATGGYPAHDDTTEGCYINYPDSDIRDPTVNGSGIAWSELYYGGNYARLQRVKRSYDPADFFRNSQSIGLA